MSGTFVPVDLDQVLDDFEAEEMNHGSASKTSISIQPNDSVSVPHDTCNSHVRFPSIDGPRTYSFNGPLDEILKEQSSNIHNSIGTSLAQELADHNFGPQHHDDDEEEVHHDDDDIHHNTTNHSDVGLGKVDIGNDSERASGTSSTTDVIAAAEKIIADNDFSLQQLKPSSTSSVSTLQTTNFGISDFDERVSAMSSNLPSQSTGEKKNENVENEPDFLSLLNSVVEEKSLCQQGSKSQTASFSSFDGSTSSNSELTNEMKDMLVDDASDKDEATRHQNSELTQTLSKNEAEIKSLFNTDSAELSTTKQLTELGNDLVDNYEEINIKRLSEEVTDNDGDRFAGADKIPSTEASQGIINDNLPGTSSSQDNLSDDAGVRLDRTSSSSRIMTDTETSGGHEFYNTIDNELSDTAKCIESWDKENVACGLEAERELPQDLQPVQKSENKNGTATVNPVNPTDSSLTVEDGLPQGVRQDGTTENDPSVLLDFSAQEQVSLANRMSCIDSGSADSLCGTQDEDIDGNQSHEPELPSDVQPNPEPQFESQLETKMTAVHISSGDPEMGFVPPIWVPDDVATHCMTCGLKFSLIKRKHHCRACGKVLCSTCCNMKFPLPYMGNKDARVCQVCCDVLLRSNQRRMSTENLLSSPAPVISDEQEFNGVTDLDDDNELTTEMPPPSEPEDLDDDELLNLALEENEDEVEQEDPQENNLDSSYPVVPVLSLPSDPGLLPVNNGSSSASLTPTPLSPTLSDDSDISFRLDVEHVRALIPQESSALPPVLNLYNKAISINEHPDPAEIMYRLKGKGETITFLLNKNLIVKVKIVKLRCCVKKKCWCFVTDGMGAASQEEMVVLLECQHNENAVPKDVLSHFNTAFSYAKQGHVVSDLGFTIFGQPFLGSSGNAGFLYIKPSYQCLENLPLPSVPYVIGILIQRKEAPWAQLFPLRLMLRLGTEFRYYPCPLWSVRNRPSVYGDIGHTIMNLLTDFKNFQYSIPRITGLIIHMENTKTTVRLPQDRYDEIIKVLNAAEEHMFAFGANFSSEADSHLVCIQEGETYKTQAINIQNKTRKVTGASFIVFTGSLKTSSPNDAKVSIIEDGLMIQMLPDSILELRKALREMQDYVIKTGCNTPDGMVNQVTVEWASRDANKEKHTSPIDGRSLTDVPSIQVHSSCDFTKPDIYRIRWTNVFLERNGSSRGLSSRGLSHLTAELARACCEALRPHLVELFDLDLTHLSLRVNLDTDSVEYSIGAKEKPLPANLMADMDSAIVPAINTAAMKHRRGPLTVELFFSIISLF